MPAFRLFQIAVLVAIGVSGGTALAQDAGPVCPPTTAKVESARRVPAAYDDEAQPSAAPASVEMGDTIEITGTDLEKAATCGGTTKPLVLMLGGHALPDVHPETIGAALRFKLKRDDASKGAWTDILGKPQTNPRLLSVSVGAIDGTALPSRAAIPFVALPILPFGICLVGVALLLAAFLMLAARTNILRDGSPDHSTAPTGQYSLSKTQAAWWFFVVLSSYLVIGIVTGDFTTSLNGTALTLLAIGGGTAIGSAVIASSRNNAPDEVQARQDATAEVDKTVQALDVKAAPTPAETNKLAAAKQTQAVLAGTSQGFPIDIVTDADGVCFHRFQNVAWTVTLTGIFLSAVYKTLAMPDFDATLLGLLGISSLTYLGLKPTEATIPKSVRPAG